MTDFVVTLRQLLSSLHDMTPGEYDALQDDEWGAMQDMQEVCQRIASRIAALDGASFVAAAKVLPTEPTELTQGVDAVDTIESDLYRA